MKKFCMTHRYGKILRPYTLRYTSLDNILGGRGGNVGAGSVLPNCHDSTPLRLMHGCTYSQNQ